MQGLFYKGSMTARKVILFTVDVLCFLVSFFVCSLIFWGIGGFADSLLKSAPFAAALLLAVSVMRILAKMYGRVWRYANTGAYLRMILADAASFAVAALPFLFNLTEESYRIFWQCGCLAMMNCLFGLSNRLIYQQLYQRTNKSPAKSNNIRVAIVGAGQIGCLLAEELTANPASGYTPVCFVDTDRTKIGNQLNQLPVYAEEDAVLLALQNARVQEIFVALPSVDGDRMKEILNFYKKAGYKVKVYGMPVDAERKLSDKNGKRVLREIEIEDLLFRESLVKKDEKVDAYYRGKTVLVTGGGGSIGSELCRQIASRGPKKLIIVDIYENNAYDIQQELLGIYGGELELSVEIASIRDRRRLENVFELYRPQIVFHAAAHKHVPLMEHSGAEAIKNNVMGTFNTVETAEKYGVEKFIMISTDKAVNPTNIMGASKRMCEMIVQSRLDSDTVFSCVRFGNVLGSNGSVIPLFRRQIESGGPVTITDKRIIRYFMTIPEAAQLVMTAGAMADRGELFVLDMGKPVRILELAENMIRLMGLKPYKDIDICEIGLRPGEKLYEELLIKNENLDKTENDLIFIERDRPFPREAIAEKLDALREAVEAAENAMDYSGIKPAMKAAVPTFRDPEEVNAEAEKTEEMKAVAEV